MPTQQQTFLGRQPILDRRERIYGYELLFRGSADATSAVIPDQDQASAGVIVDAFASMGTETVLGPHFGFVNVSRAMLLDEALEALPRERVVLELLEDIPPDPETITRCVELREAGFRLALDDFVPDDPRIVLLELVDMVKVDLMGLTEGTIAGLVRQLRGGDRTLLAEKVETREQFASCEKLGFDYFQGFYFAKPTTLSGWRMAPENAALLSLLSELSDCTDVANVEDRFKRSADLSINLLRIVNSAGRVSRHKIQSLRHAIVFLGHDALRRWLLLLLYASSDGNNQGAPLFSMAAVRGRMLELLQTGQPGLAPLAQEGAAGFLVGMLSLVGALMGRDAEEVLAELHVDDAIKAAVLERDGDFGKLLSIVEHLEQAEFTDLAVLLAELGITTEELVAAQRNAYAWVNELEVSLSSEL